MERGTIVEYLLASSALPGFVAPIIKGKKYVDGGVYDNVPYAMARQRGYKRIIAVDITGAGVTRRPDVRGAETVYIRNSVHLGGMLDFGRQKLNEIKQLGYLDTLRAFGRLEGYRYFIESNDKMEQAFFTLLDNDEGRGLLGGLGEGKRRAAARASKNIKTVVIGSIKRNDFDRPQYHYFKLLDYLLKDRTKSLLKSRLSVFFPTAQAAEFFLGVIDRLLHHH